MQTVFRRRFAIRLHSQVTRLFRVLQPKMSRQPDCVWKIDEHGRQRIIDSSNKASPGILLMVPKGYLVNNTFKCLFGYFFDDCRTGTAYLVQSHFSLFVTIPERVFSLRPVSGHPIWILNATGPTNLCARLLRKLSSFSSALVNNCWPFWT